jgi:hypothetical protein
MYSDILAVSVAIERNARKKEWIRTESYVQHKILVIVLQNLLHKQFKSLRVSVHLLHVF